MNNCNQNRCKQWHGTRKKSQPENKYVSTRIAKQQRLLGALRGRTLNRMQSNE